jgi:uncharacterized protein YutD
MNLFEQLKEDFCTAFKWLKNVDYTWSPKDNKSLGILIGKIRDDYKNKLDSEQMQEKFRELLNKATVYSTDWYKENFDMPLLNSKYNTIKSFQDNSHRTKQQKPGFYNDHKHEIEPPHKPGGIKTLKEYVENLEIPKSDSVND